MEKGNIQFTDKNAVKSLEDKYKAMYETRKLENNHYKEVEEQFCSEVAVVMSYYEILNTIHSVIFSDDQNDSKIEILKTMIQWDEIFKNKDI